MTKRKIYHPNQDFFIADMFSNLNASFKDDMATMEHPIFVLSKNKDMRCLEYKKDNVSISIIPSVKGLPTIFDKDILLYCISMLMTEVNAGRIPPKKLRISSNDLLVSTNRPTDGHGYKNLKAALDRLKGVSIKTNIKTGKREQTGSFSLIDNYVVVESSRIKDRMIKLEIGISDWIYNSVVGKEVLTINPLYFEIGKPLERRLYEIARKHCGKQKHWSINLVPLMDKTGSTSPLRKFRYFIKQICEDNHIPDYSLTIDDNDMVTFTSLLAQEEEKQKALNFDLPSIRPDTIDKGRKITLEAGTGWDFYALQSEFTQSLLEGFTPEKVDGAFINFIKNKVAKAP